MKFKKIFCNTNILILFFRLKLATETTETGEPSRSNDYNPSKVNNIENIEALYFKCVEGRGLKRVFFSVMLKVLDFMTNVKKRIWIKYSSKYYSKYIKRNANSSEKRRYERMGLGMFGLLEKLKKLLFTDDSCQELIFESSPLFEFSHKCYRCDNCNKPNPKGDLNSIHKCKKTCEYYNLTSGQAILHRNYFCFYAFVGEEVSKNFNFKADERKALLATFGMTFNNTGYSFLEVILIKCFEIVDRAVEKKDFNIKIF